MTSLKIANEVCATLRVYCGSMPHGLLQWWIIPVQIYLILQELGLAYMGLERVEVGAFCGISNISTLNLDFNKLTSLPQLCSLKCCLVKLLIGNNKIVQLSRNFFKCFQKLQIVSLNNNYLLVLPDLHWIQHSVSSLKAGSNELHSLDALQTSEIYIRLRTINVFNNDIRDFNVSLLRHMPKLDYFC